MKRQSLVLARVIWPLAVAVVMGCSGDTPKGPHGSTTTSFEPTGTTAPLCVSGDDIQVELDAGTEWVRICSGTHEVNLVLSSNVTLEGESALETRLDGAGIATVVEVARPDLSDSIDVVLRGLTITGGTSIGGEVKATAIEASYASSLLVEDVVVEGNSGLWASVGSSMMGMATFIDVTVRNNTSSAEAGGMSVGRADLTRVVVEGNQGTVGGIQLVSGTAGDVTADTDTVIRDNTGARSGGIEMSTGQSWVGGQIRNNNGSTGGGIAAMGGTLRDVVVEDNSAYVGGGLAVLFGETTVTGASISGNTAMQEGGGVYTTSNLDIQDSTLAGNDASSGGGIWLRDGVLSCTNCDLGTGPTDNTVDDVAIQGGQSYTSWGPGSTFTCDANAGTCE